MRPELISPAGDWISLRAAISSGADAVYFGTKELNMRINAHNFRISELNRISEICREKGIRTYLTLNTIIYDKELKKTERIVSKAKQAGIDAIICWDFSVIEQCRKHKIPFHISTQASVSNYEAVKHYAKLGAEKVVLARELSLEQIRKIRRQRTKDRLNIKIETFIHGAMCVSVSGRCFISQFLFNRSANRGDCLQPCRRSYVVYDPEERKELRLVNNYIMSPKDLCTIDFIDKLIESGIDSFKIEGRNRSPEYVKVTTECYRKAIDTYLSDRSRYNRIKGQLKSKLSLVYNRGFSSGFFLGKPVDEWSGSYGTKARKRKIFAGIVKNYFTKVKVAEIHLQGRGVKVNDRMMIQGKTTGIVEFRLASMLKEDEKVKRAKKGDTITVRCDKVRRNDRVYLIN